MPRAGEKLMILLVLVPASAFVIKNDGCATANSMLHASGQGFGSNSNRGGGKKKKTSIEKTYDVQPIKDIIDTESAMSDFFAAHEEWHPLFGHLATSSSAPGMSFMTSDSVTFDFDVETGPWRRLQGLPTDENDVATLASVLDSMQASLIDIPVDEKSKDDEHDLQFIEEGRRMLALNRFQVLRNVKGGCMDSFETLFSTCWSEIMALRMENEDNTGSLIVLPDYEGISDLRRFTDYNVVRPLQWLGVDVHFEVASMERGLPALRLLHKLQDIPSEPWEVPGET